MNIQKLSRERKEKLYIEKETELQLHWKNSLSSDWYFIKEWTDSELEENIKDAIGQLRFEKYISVVKKVFSFLIIIFIFLGVLGLLLFGIKQLF
ncbi:hypothetical protein KAT63_00935 [Candidatus Parcubacteria bacterium]|nr:hypothetical protein [Candidatus Parcubacteria bacterium]